MTSGAAGEQDAPSRSRAAARSIALAALALAAVVVALLLTGPNREEPGHRTTGPAGLPTSFRVATLNVLGASHTAPGGNKSELADQAPRMRTAVALLERQRVDLIGFQELERSQVLLFDRFTRGRFGVFPGTTMGGNPGRNSVGWDKRVWRLGGGRTVIIPYFGGERVPMPYVLLEHRETGARIFVINIHNPTSSPRRGDNERWRDLGTRREVALVNRLHSRVGVPVLLTGDFNETREAFCRVTAGAGMHAANGGDPGPACVPPEDAGIDWIFATGEVTFSDYARVETRGASDHAMVVVTGRLAPRHTGPESPK